MRRFKFRLENVRIDRERFESLRLREWTIVNKMMLDLVTEKQRLEGRLSEAMNEMTELNAAGRSSTSILIEMENFIQGQKQRVEWKNGEIARAEKFVERKRIEWMAARQKRKILDKVKEIQQAQHKEELRLKELKKIDEIYIMRDGFLRRERGEES